MLWAGVIRRRLLARLSANIVQCYHWQCAGLQVSQGSICNGSASVCMSARGCLAMVASICMSMREVHRKIVFVSMSALHVRGLVASNVV